MKRLRKQTSPKKIRFYMCGEYGEKTRRPHYHAILFNHDFNDKIVWDKNESGESRYTSKLLSSLWSLGHSQTADASFQSAAYISRYIMKKVTGTPADKHYQSIDTTTGEIFQLEPEYNRMSLKPGLGHDWALKYKSDIYPSGFCIINGKKRTVPQYYIDLIELTEQQARRRRMENIKQGKKNPQDQTPERRKVREIVRHARTSTLSRGL